MTAIRPLIGCTTYRKRTAKNPNIMVDGLMPVYADAVLAAGGIPIFIPLSLKEDDLRPLFDRLDGILLPGGGDIDPIEYGSDQIDKCYGINKLRDFVELTLARWAIAENKPVLGVCRGFQILNVASGGTLWEDIEEMRPNSIKHSYFQGYDRDLRSQKIRITEGSKLEAIMGTHQAKPINSIHHQGVKELGAEWTPTAYTEDGLIEAMEIESHPFAVAVQWHPEELCPTDNDELALFQALVTASS